MNTKAALLPLLLIISGCATPVPVPVTCPPPPPVPEVLTLRVSTELSLSKRYDGLMTEFRESLKKATRTP